jgi:hypothetical protein
MVFDAHHHIVDEKLASCDDPSVGKMLLKAAPWIEIEAKFKEDAIRKLQPWSRGSTTAPPADQDLSLAGKGPAQPQRSGGRNQQQGNQRAFDTEHAAGQHRIAHQLAAQQAAGGRMARHGR